MDGSANRLNAAGLVLGSLFGLLVLSALLLLDWRLRLGLMLAFAAMLLLAGWGALVSSLLAQNKASLARLVPGHAKALRRSLLLSWLLLSATGMAGSALWIGNPLTWGLPFSAALVLLAWAQRHPGFWSLGPLLCLQVVLILGLERLPDWLHSSALHLAWPWHVLLLSASALLLMPLIQQGGRQHRHNQRRLMRWREATRDEGSAWSYYADPNNWGRWGRLSRRFYDDALQRQSARQTPQVQQGWLLGLGPALHWSGPLTGLGLFTLGLLALLLVMQLMLLLGIVDSPRAFGSLGGFVAGAALGPLIGSSLQIFNTLRKTRAEQDLLLLLPGAPRGPAMNRLLAGRLMLNYLASWVALSAGLAALLSPWPRLLPLLLILMLAALNPLWLLCRDWSRPAQLRAAQLAALAGGALILFGLLAFHTEPLWHAALPMLGFTVAMTAWRWHCLPRWPAALPAGRR